MSVFQLALDETQGEANHFFHGGYIAPAADWTDWFIPAWETRVLRGLPYLHMVEILSLKWQRQHGLTETEAQRRIDEAVNVVSSLGSLVPVISDLSATAFATAFETFKVIRPNTKQPGTYSFEPDYLTFSGLVFGALQYAYGEKADRVDFVVEKKQDVTRRMQDFFDGFPRTLKEDGGAHLVPLLGKLIPVDKSRMEVQASDLMCWHLQRMHSGFADARDRNRFERILSGNRGVVFTYSDADLISIRERYNEEEPERPFKPKPPRRSR